MKDEVRAWMRPVLADGGTKPAESLQTALAMRPDVIFFLTDGKIPDNTDEILRANNFHGTVIHTTALVTHEGEAILRQIAADHDGTYRHVGALAVESDLPGRFAQADGSKFGRLLQEDLGQLREAREAREKRQRAASAKLRLARKYLQEGRPLTGRRWLEKVIQEYPGTSQASEARQLIRAL